MISRTLILMLALAAAGAVGCLEPPTEPKRPVDTAASRYPLDTFDCAPPSQNANGDVPPLFAHYQKIVTADGRSMVYLSTESAHIRVVDLGSLVERRVDLQSLLPDNVALMSVGWVVACPYDPNVVLVRCVTTTDTTGDGRSDGAGVNYYRLTLDGRSAERVTPRMYGQTGSFIGYHFYVWLNTSKSGPDSLLGAFGGVERLPDIGWERIYIPSRDTMVLPPTGGIATQTRDGHTRLIFTWEGAARKMRTHLNDVELHLDGDVSTITHYSFSPDGRKLSFLITPEGPDTVRRYGEIWIVDVEKYLRERPTIAEVQVINTQKRFCTYGNLDPVFVTNTTLAVSMRRDLEPGEYIWEITLDGRRVRQLTFAP